MPDNTHRIRSVAGSIVVDLSHGDDNNILHLNVDEARTLGVILDRELMSPGDDVIVWDAVLTAAEARSLSVQLDAILTALSRPHKVNWQKEGF